MLFRLIKNEQRLHCGVLKRKLGRKSKSLHPGPGSANQKFCDFGLSISLPGAHFLMKMSRMIATCTKYLPHARYYKEGFIFVSIPHKNPTK